jgi:hypothetical protein
MGIGLLYTLTIISFPISLVRHVVAQVVEALRYTPVRFPMVSMEFFIDVILPAALCR